jgi:hypothetical protein
VDVLVTVPKDYDLSHKMASAICYWRIRGTPRRTKRGEKIYFVHDGEIALVADIVGVGEDYINFEDLRYLPKPRARHQGFRGFRYREAS